jgi:hypothetical protein
MTEKPIPDAESGHDLEPSERRNSAASSLTATADRCGAATTRPRAVRSLVGDAYYGEDRYQTARGAEAHRPDEASRRKSASCSAISPA